MPTSERWPLAWPAMSLPVRQENAGSVLVVVETERAARLAVPWAASEAAVRGSALRLVRSARLPYLPLDPRLPMDPWSWTTGSSPAESAVSAARARLATAAAEARTVEPGLSVSTEVLSTAVAPPGRVAHALLVVEKHSGINRLTPRSALRAAALGSSSRPVVVVDLSDRPTPGAAAGRVVVVLSATADPTHLLDAAFRAALRRGLGLTVLTGRGQRVSDRLVAELLDPYRIVFPEIEVSVRHVAGSAGDLAVEATGAVLTVAGRPPRGARRAERAVSRRLRRSLRGPVMLVPVDGPEPGAQVRS